MSTAVRVGVFAVFTVLAVFVVWSVLNSFTVRRNSYLSFVLFR